ncbi:MAG: hypothetical protein BZ135_01855 [Methanosphaera sp. rholeuAM6]|nr:MAG: hypothetical protein BZ135_01855 [Methanosphaera sp. rholeuAM6]
MRYIEINGKILRKDAKYYLQDILDYPEFDGSYEQLEEYLLDVNEECEIHIVNCACIAGTFIDVFLDCGNSLVTVFVDD